MVSEVAASDTIAIVPPPEGLAKVVFWRAGTIVGMFESCAVSEGEAKLSSLPRGRFFTVIAAPGRHTYAVRDLGQKREILLDLAPGEIRYVECNTVQHNGGMLGQSGLATLLASSESAFRAKNSLKPVDGPPPPAPVVLSASPSEAGPNAEIATGS